MLRPVAKDARGVVIKCADHNLPLPCLLCGRDFIERVPAAIHHDQTAVFHALWAELHNAVDPTEEWFLAWRSRLPKTCNCEEGYQELFESLPPVYGEGWFRWTFELRNRVRAKLNKQLFTWCDALEEWRPQLRWSYRQPKITSCIAVTSLAPHRLERQLVCLDSWRRFGLDIVSVNSPAEIATIAKDYPQVSHWVPAEFETTPRINSLIDVAHTEGTPVLLINSDIEIYGHQDRLTDLVASRKSAIAIRHNYEVQPGDSAIEPWGLDAFLIYPEQSPKLSRVDFAIGKPMWDYWIATELESMGDCEWIGEPYFFHRSHPVAWTQEECTSAHEAFATQFGPMDWTQWRSSRPGR